MAETPLNKETLPSHSILVDGSEIPNHYGCMSIRVNRSLNKVAYATIEFLEGGSSEEEKFEISDGGLFDPGNKVTIKAGYEFNEEAIFEGLIIKQSLSVDKDGRPNVIVECKDEAIKLTVGRKNSVFYEKTDSDIIREVVNQYGLDIDIDDTSVNHKEIIQHYSNDWDFILLRSELNGLYVTTEDSKLSIKKPVIEEAVLTVGYGTGLISFNGDIDARKQYKNVVSHSWDMDSQQVLDASGEVEVSVSQGDLSGKKLAEVIGLEEYVQQSSANMDESMLKTWSSSKMTRAELSRITGTLVIRGNSKVKPGKQIEIQGLSKHFNGNAFIGGVMHVLEEGGWETEIQVGIPENAYSEEAFSVEAPGASGMVPPIKGLHIGLVKKIDEDPDGNYRVQVAIPTLKKDNMPVWARLSNFYSTNEAGVFFYPEINDEVIVGFLNEDPQYPIILGSVYSKAIKPKYMPEAENGIKSIFTKGELEIQFNDTDKILTIHTPGENSVILDDKNKTITVEDVANKNKVVMSSSGISMEAEKDISLKANGNIILEAASNIQMKATKDFTAEGMNVSLKGNTKFAAEGTQAELKGSATTTIKGAMVQIN